MGDVSGISDIASLAKVVYLLCAATSLACAVLLLRSWWKSRRALPLWSALCFVGLLINNAMLVLDKVVFPTIDMAYLTKLPAAVGLALFLFGLIWDDS